MRIAVSLSLALVGAACGRIDYAVVDASPRDAPPFDVGPPVDAGRDGSGGGDVDATVDDGGADAPFDAGSCSEDPCRLVLPQCGCPPGQMCTRPLPMSTTRDCRPIGPSPVGGGCAVNTDCTIGTVCVRANGAGICVLWCEGDADCPDASVCARFASADPTIGACTWNCDPIEGSGCPDGMMCYLAHTEQLGTMAVIGMTLCAAPGSVPINGPCTQPFDCAPGGFCAASALCLPVCSVGDPCAGGTCRSASPPILIGGIEYGGCS